uniref:RT06290p n=1 Tax=Drosophila melanogaster TaxID=7227 RepID=F5XVG8_DROME|nr:RT06290p [Drosophila melanogaster]
MQLLLPTSGVPTNTLETETPAMQTTYWPRQTGNSKSKGNTNCKCNINTHRKSRTRCPDNGKTIWAVGFTLVLLTCLQQLKSVSADEESQDFQKNIPARLVWAALGETVELPCDLTPPTSQDLVKLLLWFKDTTGIPLYSLDSRGGNVKLAPHAAIASDLGQRLFFSIGDNPKDSRLQINDVKPEDGGVYRCRVDFFNSPTRNFRHNLTLVVPPEEPRIFDAQGKEISQMAGPFREGYELFLCCQVRGDPPTVSVHLANEDPSRLVTRAEGQNVTFKCRADARPPVTSYSWFKNGMRMSGESTEIMHLTQLERESAGAYACGATNTEGETRSSSLTLKVQYESILSEDPTPAETTHHGGGGVGGSGSSSGLGTGASTGSGPEKQSTLLILAAVVVIGAVVVTSIIVAGIVVVCRHRPRPPEPQEVRKSMRPARNDVPSMYIEEDELNELEEGGGRAADIRARVAPPNSHLCGGGGMPMPGGVGSSGGAIVGVAGPHHYISESFIQYAQPSLNDPDLILPRGELEFTTLDPTLK